MSLQFQANDIVHLWRRHNIGAHRRHQGLRRNAAAQFLGPLSA